ncbi:MAG: hypothetical protein ACK5NK_16300 [Niabella sp.]
MKNLQKETHGTLPFVCEAVCAELLQKISFEDLKTQYIGNFKKSFSNDIENIEIEEFGKNTACSIQINRNGIYDLLPEGLFHQTLGSSRVKNVKDAVSEHKRFNAEEKNARKFFAPIEQILFRYKIQTEIAENSALYDIQNGKLNNSFYDFWNLDKSLPIKEANRLLHLMPHCNFIKGNKAATTIALAYILNKEVSIVEEYRCNTIHLTQTQPINEIRLGVDAVLGTEAKEIMQYWIFNVDNIANEDLPDYVQDGNIGKLLNRFTEIFIPLEIDVVYDINKATQQGNDTLESILGYGSRL